MSTAAETAQADYFQMSDMPYPAKCGSQGHKEYREEAESDSPLYRTDEFRIYCYKVLPCSKRYCHDWTMCPFAHPGEKAKRRDCRVYSYTGIACPEMKKSGQCPRGDACPYSHNVFEYWLHPSRYRTQLCNDGTNCKRKVCFFAHTLEELRVPPCKQPGTPSPRNTLDMATAAQLFGAASPTFDAQAHMQAAGMQPVRYASGEDPFYCGSPSPALQSQHAMSQAAPFMAAAGNEPVWERTSSGSLSPNNSSGANVLTSPFASDYTIDVSGGARGVNGRSLSHQGSFSCPVPSSPQMPGTPSGAQQRMEQLADQLANMQLGGHANDPTVAGLLSMLVQEVRTARQQQAQHNVLLYAAQQHNTANTQQHMQRMNSMGALSPNLGVGAAGGGLTRAPLYPLAASPRLTHMQSLPAALGCAAPMAPCSPVLAQQRRCSSIELQSPGPYSMGASSLSTPANSEYCSSGSFALPHMHQPQQHAGMDGQQYNDGAMAAMLGQHVRRTASNGGPGSGQASPQCADLPCPPAFSLCHSLFSQQASASQVASEAEQLLAEAFGAADAAATVGRVGSSSAMMSAMGTASAGY